MKVFVIGSGTMGKGIVQLFAQASFVKQIYWKASSEEKSIKAINMLEDRWLKAIEKEKIEESDFQVFKSKLTPVLSYESVSESDFAIEAVKEDMAVKCDVFRQISHFAGPKTIFATNTSSLSITQIASSVRYPENFVGLHFFNPAPVMQLTEIVSGLLTSEDTIRYVYDLSCQLGKSPVRVKESPGFIVNRMLIPMINEAVGTLAEGVASAEDIDAAMCNGANHPIGPLALADLIGTDVCLSIMEVLHNETGDPKYRAHPLLRKMVRGGKLGRKSKSGFFEYK